MRYYGCTHDFLFFVLLFSHSLRSVLAASAELVVVPGDSTATEGNTLILTCVGFGVPLPNVYFSRNGTQLTTNNSRVSIFTEVVEEQGLEFVQVTLQICGLDRELDTGNYSCTANNSNGTQTSSFEVTVNAFGKTTKGAFVCVMFVQPLC